MLNLLLVSSHYASTVSVSCSHAFAFSSLLTVLGIIVIIYIMITLYMSHTISHRITKYAPMGYILIAILVCTFFGNVGSDVNSEMALSPQSIHSSYTVKGGSNYSKYTLPHTDYIIHHNRKVLPHEWHHDGYLIHHVDKCPSHNNISKIRTYTLNKIHQAKYQKRILHQEHFDRYNTKYCTKKYIQKPRWYNYL